MPLAIKCIGTVGIRRTFAALLVLSLALVPCPARADLNGVSPNFTGESAPGHSQRKGESDEHFLAAFRTAPLSLIQVITLAERLHPGSRTLAISFDLSDNPSYRVMTVRNKEVWENVIDVRRGRATAAEVRWTLNELEIGQRNNITALRTVKQRLSEAVAIAEKAAGGKAIAGGLVSEGDRLNFGVMVLSEDRVKEVFLEPPSDPATARDE